MTRIKQARCTKWIALVSCAIWFAFPATAFSQFMTDPAGGGMAHVNHQPGLGLNHLVALSGIFPSRNAANTDERSLGTGVYIGEIKMFAGNFAPAGYAFADGQLLDISQNTALFSLLGTTYGGNGQSTFALPDLRGRSAMHQGAGPGLTPRAMGVEVGTDEATVSVSQMAPHVHDFGSFPGATDPVGGGAAHPNMKPSLGINYFVNRVGIYPSESPVDESGGGSSFIGGVRMSAFNFAPVGSSEANGQTLTINQNDALFTLLGTTYGGDGQTEFDLPDLRGRLSIHDGIGAAPGLTDRSLGESGGQESVSLTHATIPTHDHAAAIQILDAGGGEAHDNMQPFNTLNYIVALQGLFPSDSLPEGGGGEPILGEVQMFAGSFAPAGWAFADGQILQISQNQALFALLGTTYGGDGQSTFGLPDLRGRAPVHVGSGGGDFRSWSRGEKFGVESVFLNEAQLPIHSHNYVPEPSGLPMAMVILCCFAAMFRSGAHND